MAERRRKLGIPLFYSDRRTWTTAEIELLGTISDRKLARRARHGAIPFIAFKSTHTGASGGLWEKMYHFFSFKRAEFLAHYHKRSNVESTVSMIKAKFRDHVRSKTDVAMKNEVLCKVLCHNICCLVSAIYELGITPDFCMEE